MSADMYRKLRKILRAWWACKTKQCDYYEHYLAYGLPELSHIGYHAAEKLASNHFANCQYNGPGFCSACTRWEQRLRA